MSVNKLLTSINLNCDRRKEENSSLDKSDKSIEIYKTYISCVIYFDFVYKNVNFAKI